MTPHDVALHMMRQRRSTVSDPAFIVAYLEAELAASTPVTPAVEEALIRRLQDVTDAVTAFARAWGRTASTLSIDITRGDVTLRA